MDRERIEERRGFAWRCAEDDSGFALEKMDEIISDLLERVEELENALDEARCYISEDHWRVQAMITEVRYGKREE